MQYHDKGKGGIGLKVLLFGTGDYYNRYKKWFKKEEIIALLDNSDEKKNTMIDGIQVLSPEIGIQLDFDIIVILSFYIKAMKKQLLELGVAEECIYHFFDLHKLITEKEMKRPVKYYGNTNITVKANSNDKKNGKIVLLSHDLTLGGPALALFHAAEVLCKKGYQVIFASMLDGPLKEMLLEREIPVVVDENMQIATMSEVNWIREADLIVCNTICYYVFLSERYIEIPVIWWLHDSAFFYDSVDREVLRKIDMTNLEIVSVGPVPRKVMQIYRSDFKVGTLLYGVMDAYDKNGNTLLAAKDGLVCFITIGYIEARKGQDILIKAIKMLPQNILEKCEFCFVGQDTSMLAQRLKEESRDISQIKLIGTVGRNEIHTLLRKSDMMICPSREDPMPTVVAEAMMQGVPCIVSDAVGTAEYIHNREEGLLFPSENAEELADRIEWCVCHQKELYKMGNSARRVYERVFSMEAFEHNFVELIENFI